MPAAADSKRRFWHISAAGVFFQGGAVAVDTNTLMAALVHQLTGSAFAVGATAAIARFGWLFPQLFVAYYAQRSARRLPFYMLGAFGRVTCRGRAGTRARLAGGRRTLGHGGARLFRAGLRAPRGRGKRQHHRLSRLSDGDLALRRAFAAPLLLRASKRGCRAYSPRAPRRASPCACANEGDRAGSRRFWR